MRFVELGKPESGGELASPEPLDDVSFLYHVEPRIRASGLFGEVARPSSGCRTTSGGCCSRWSRRSASPR
jgi:hypothetical protein